METFRFLIIFAVIFGNSVKASIECNEDQEGCKHLKRKRRAVPEGSCIDGAKSPQQARDELKGYEGQIAVSSYNDTTMSKKRQLLTAAKSLIPAVCKNMTVGAAPVQAVSTLVGIHVQRKACDKTISPLSDVPCEGCSTIAKYRIKENLLEKNSHWNCSQSNDTCDGVCIGSMRMPKDLMSNYSTGCRSDVVYVQMFNPKSAQPVEVNSSGEDMLVEIEFNEDRSKTNDSDYKCSMWRPDADRWDDSVCNLTILPRRSESLPYVAQCSCTPLGSVCVAFSTTDMNNPTSSSPTTVPGSGGSSGGGGATTASSGSGETTTASSGGSSGGGGATTTSSGGSSGGGGATTASSGSGETTTASSGGSSGGGGATTASSGGSSGGGGATTASSGSGETTTAASGENGGSSGGGGGGGGATTASSGGSGGGGGATTAGSVDNSGTLYVSLKLEGDCNTIVGTKMEQPFRDAAIAKLQETFHVKQDQIVNLEITCGSIILSFYINQLDPAVVRYNITNIGQITTSNFTITLPDGSTFTPIQADVGYAPGNFTRFLPPQPTVPSTTGKRYELVFDYTPIMITVALGIALVVLCVCCTCIIHSWYLRKEKYTEYNSMTIKEYEEKMRAKEQKGMGHDDIPMTNMGPAQAAARPNTTNFDMTNEEMPQINERTLTNYDWARTSYLPGMLARPAGTETEEAPRLILDKDSDSEAGEDNEGFEKSTLDIPKSASHLSLDHQDPDESNDASSQKNYEAPPLYDNVADAPEDSRDPEQKDIYDNINLDNPYDNPDGASLSTPEPTESEYSTVQ